MSDILPFRRFDDAENNPAPSDLRQIHVAYCAYRNAMIKDTRKRKGRTMELPVYDFPAFCVWWMGLSPEFRAQSEARYRTGYDALCGIQDDVATRVAEHTGVVPVGKDKKGSK